jgi:hypothetical protein
MTAFVPCIVHVQAENDQWTKETRECEDELGRLGGDCVLAAASMEYLGAFSQQHRPDVLAAIAKLASQYTHASSASQYTHASSAIDKYVCMYVRSIHTHHRL